jgi:hypothetical protein
MTMKTGYTANVKHPTVIELDHELDGSFSNDIECFNKILSHHLGNNENLHEKIHEEEYTTAPQNCHNYSYAIVK